MVLTEDKKNIIKCSQALPVQTVGEETSSLNTCQNTCCNNPTHSACNILLQSSLCGVPKYALPHPAPQTLAWEIDGIIWNNDE